MHRYSPILSAHDIHGALYARTRRCRFTKYRIAGLDNSDGIGKHQLRHVRAPSVDMPPIPAGELNFVGHQMYTAWHEVVSAPVAPEGQ